MTKFIIIVGIFALFSVVEEIRGTPTKNTLQLPECTTDCEEQAKNYLENQYETESSKLCQLSVQADWNYNTDLANSEKEQAVADANIAYSKFQFDAWNTIIKKYNYSDFVNESIKRQLKFLNIVGIAALSNEDLVKYNDILGKMAKAYGTAKICPFEKQSCDLSTEGLNLEPEIEEIISTSQDSKKLAYTWEAWHSASGKPIRELYKEYIRLSNIAAKANGMENNGDLWLARYEAADFRNQVKVVWEDVKELYVQLYAYVRFKLMEKYPDDFEKPDDPIPAHLLGNMWGQTWEGIYSLVIPYPNDPGFDVSEKLQEKFNSSLAGIKGIFIEANEFFTGLGLSDMSMSYGDTSMIIRPPDKEVVCHASAWDFCDKTDYRIKMCTNVNQEDYATVHHELGHIQYFLNYKNQPITFRDGANPGFHEAIGDVISLSVATPKHMKKLGYLDGDSLNHTVTMNFLMKKALEKIAFLPFGYLIDAYRWSLFDGSTSMDKMEYAWLKIRNEVQGLIPPVTRTEDDFDAGAKYHVPGNTPYIRYFVSFILQFQIHKKLCLVANEYVENDPEKPLYNCDIAGNPAAGTIMKTLLEKGFADNWQDVLEEAIGERNMDGSAIKEYFAPLTAFFKEQQEQHKYPLGWTANAFERFYKNTVENAAKRNADISTVLALSCFILISTLSKNLF